MGHGGLALLFPLACTLPTRRLHSHSFVGLTAFNLTPAPNKRHGICPLYTWNADLPARCWTHVRHVLFPLLMPPPGRQLVSSFCFCRLVTITLPPPTNFCHIPLPFLCLPRLLHSFVRCILRASLITVVCCNGLLRFLWRHCVAELWFTALLCLRPFNPRPALPHYYL